MQCQNFCRLFCATNLDRARDCNWINVIAWINIVFGLICGFVLISEITAELSIPSAASPHSPGIWSFILLKLFYLLGSGIKFGMGLLLLIGNGNSQKNRRIITTWLTVTVLLLLVEMTVVTPAVVILLNKIDLIGVVGWELPWWIATLVSLYVVNQHRNKLATDKIYQNNNGNQDLELDCNNRADSQMLPLPRSRSSSISTSISASVVSNNSNKEQLETSQV